MRIMDLSSFPLTFLCVIFLLYITLVSPVLSFAFLKIAQSRFRPLDRAVAEMLSFLWLLAGYGALCGVVQLLTSRRPFF